MNPIIIDPTEFSPGVILDSENLKFKIYGESRPENARKFFEPLIKWLDEYRLNLSTNGNSEKDKKIVFEFNFDYFNSTSGKFILDILNVLDKFLSQGNNIEVKWYYDKRDEDMKDSGVEFSKFVKPTFEFISR